MLFRMQNAEERKNMGESVRYKNNLIFDKVGGYKQTLTRKAMPKDKPWETAK